MLMLTVPAPERQLDFGGEKRGNGRSIKSFTQSMQPSLKFHDLAFGKGSSCAVLAIHTCSRGSRYCTAKIVRPLRS